MSNYAYKQIRNLDDKQEYTLHVGWPGHSICVVFTRDKEDIIIRVDNLGRGYRRNHLTRGNGKGKLVQSKFIAKLMIGNIDENLDALKKYLSSLFMNVAYDYPEDKKTIERLIGKVYNPEPSFTCPSDQQITETYTWHSAQTVGNCTFASFSVGVCKRLEEDLFETIITRELGLIKSIQGSFRKEPALKAIQMSDFFQIDQENDFSFQLKNTLEENYKNLFPEESFPYIMKPVVEGPLSSYTTPSSQGLIGEMKKIFNSQDQSQQIRVMITGCAGIGKTILSKQFSKQWHLDPKLKGIVIHLSLRNLSNEQNYPNKNYNLIDIVNQEIFQKKYNVFQKRLLDYELKQNDVIWVIDGLDELRILPQLEGVIKELTEQKVLIVTSRPDIKYPPESSINKLESSINKRIYLGHYPETEIYQYIDNYFEKKLPLITLNDPLNPRDKLKKAIEVNAQLRNLCSVPVTLEIICKLIKEGHENILTCKNLAKIYNCFIIEMLRSAHKRQNKKDPIEHDRQLIDSYRRAIRFTQRLAFETLKKHRSLISSRQLINYCLAQCKFDQESAKKTLFEELSAIGLVEVGENGAEFVHASFEEYFAARYLIKSLKKSERTPAYKEAKKFIEKHRFDPNYKHLFSLVIYQLLFVLTEKKEREEREIVIDLLETYLSHFTNIPELREDFYAQGIGLLGTCFEGIPSDLSFAQNFIDRYSPFIKGAFEQLLLTGLTGDIKRKSKSFIFSPNPPSWELSTFVTLLTTVPDLKKQFNTNSELMSNISKNLTNPDLLELIWNSISLIESTESLNANIFCELNEFIKLIEEGATKISFVQGLLELTMKYVENILQKKNLSDQDNHDVVKMTPLICSQLDFLYPINKNTCEILIVEKLIDFHSLISKRPSCFEQTSLLLPRLYNYIGIMFSSKDDIKIAKCWKKLNFIEPALDMKAIVKEQKNNLEKSIGKLKRKIRKFFEEAKGRDNRQEPSRADCFVSVGFALDKLLIAIDWIDPSFGTELIDDLIHIVKTGKGKCTSPQAIEDCKWKLGKR